MQIRTDNQYFLLLRGTESRLLFILFIFQYKERNFSLYSLVKAKTEYSKADRIPLWRLKKNQANTTRC